MSNLEKNFFVNKIPLKPLCDKGFSVLTKQGLLYIMTFVIY